MLDNDDVPRPPAHPANSDPSTESPTEPVKEKNDGPPLIKSTGQEQPRPVKLEEAADNPHLKGDIQQLNDRRSASEVSGCARKSPEPEDSGLYEDPETYEDSELDEDSAFEQREGDPSRRGSVSLMDLATKQGRRRKALKEMMASGALMAEASELSYHIQNQEDVDNHNRPDWLSYDDRDDSDVDVEIESREDPGEGSGDNLLNASQLNYATWESFQLHGGSFAIDVLVGEPEPNVEPLFPGMLQPTTRSRRKGAGQTARANFGSALSPTRTPAMSMERPPSHAQRSKLTRRPIARGQTPLPERIRINSPAIIKLLDKVSEMDETRSEPPGPVLMMQPFRALVYYKDEIRNWKTRLEAEVKERSEAESDKKPDPEDTGEPDTATQAEDTSERKNDVSSEPDKQSAEDEKQRDLDPVLSNKKAVDDIACLVKFIDNELEGRIAYLAGDDCAKVAFSDIWLLFKPGDIVLSRNGKQAYRVIKTEHAKHNMKMPSPLDYWKYGAKARLEDHPVKIQCVYVDFDGEQIGPVLQTFSFHRFEGEKNVRSLDIVPLRLAKDADKLREMLVQRGSTFIDACGTGRHGVPMHYSGLTLDTKEEVDSQVVIDFEEAISVHSGGYKSGKDTGLTPENVILEMIAQQLKDELKGKDEDFYLIGGFDSLVRNWKPTVKDIDTQGGEAKDSDSDSDSDSVTWKSKRSKKNLKCIPECCANESVYEDVYIEHRLSNEFIQDQFRAQTAGSLAVSVRPLKEAVEDKDFITDNERLIVTYRVFGFIMRSRKWAQLDLTYLGPAKGENTFDLLVLPPGHRRMVESLVTQHYLDKASAFDETDEMDIVRGKGKGLIILLHGAPGVGKTTTAECVANYFQKPLFQITCGDLGSTADAVERSLEKNFALASRWGCILLIDEADVFLEARQTENFDRNSLVAVFLRTLEYYTGILFLTTNRVGTFDEAFTSRIHISLYYPPLNRDSTLAVFEVNLNRIKERFHRKKQRGVAELELDEPSIDRFIRGYFRRHEDARWNGRQIRNACQTALALAEFEAQKAANPSVDAPEAAGGAAKGGRKVMDIVAASSKMIRVKMTAKHFQDVAKAYLAFMRYLKEVHGMSAAQQARSFRLRHDRYGLGEPAAGSGLLASRQRGGASSGGGGTQRRPVQRGPVQRRPVQKQGVRRTGVQGPRLRVEDRYMEEDVGDYGYDEDDLYGEEQDEDAMLYDEHEEDEDDEEGEEYLEDEYLEEDDDFGTPEDEQGAEEDDGEYWDEQPQQDDEYLYEPQLRARPQPAGGGRGPLPRGRGQHQAKYKASATAHPRADGLGRGKGVHPAPSRSSGGPAKAPRGDHLPLGRGRGRGMGAAPRARSPRVAARQE